MAEIYSIHEFASFISGKKIEGYTTLPERTFRELQEFLLESRGKRDALEFMSVTARRGVGTVITAQNYVGLLTMNDGTTIEILPKIYGVEPEKNNSQIAREVLLNMLRALPNTPFKTIQSSNMEVAKLPILEIFIRSFIEELFAIVKHGLRCNYDQIEANEPFFKGKLIFAEHIRRNYAHQERNFVQYDVFHTNCPENRVLKATLVFLYQKTTSAQNKRDIKALLNIFDGIPTSKDYEADFVRCSHGRDAKDYRVALLWAKIFLTGKSFTAYAGAHVAFALLYPMETLFENYVASMLKSQLDSNQYTLAVQEKKKYLFDYPEKHFLLKPDIVVRRRSDGAIFILDTKWKILSQEKPNYGISQADIYQMYAYQKRYSANHVTLIYPRTELLAGDEAIMYSSNDNTQIQVRFVDLLHMKASIEKVKDLL